MKEGSFCSQLVAEVSVSFQNFTSCSELEGPGISPSSWTSAGLFLQEVKNNMEK